MFGFINKTPDQTSSARGDVYRLFESPKPTLDDGKRKALLESAKDFFVLRKAVGPVTAFTEALKPGVQPGWLLWAVSPAISQADHNNIALQSRRSPQSPPWRHDV